jgi:hypothetical protein
MSIFDKKPNSNRKVYLRRKSLRIQNIAVTGFLGAVILGIFVFKDDLRQI